MNSHSDNNIRTLEDRAEINEQVKMEINKELKSIRKSLKKRESYSI